MQISGEGKIGIGLALLFGVGTGASVIWPDQKLIGWAIMGFSALGLVALGINHFWEAHKKAKLPILPGNPVVSNLPAPTFVDSETGQKFTTRSPRELLNLYGGGVTSLQGDERFKPYAGLWLQLVGKVLGVHRINGTQKIFLKPKGLLENQNVVCNFSDEWKDHLLMLKKGEKVSVVGRLSNTHSRMSLILWDCRISVTNPQALLLPSPAPSNTPRKTKLQTHPSPISQ